jgi:hypothetical protein
MPASELRDCQVPASVVWGEQVAGVLTSAAASPRAPWMVRSDGGSFLTFAITALLWETRWREPWLQRATDCTEAQIEADLDALQNGQQDDGGWTFDWLAWSPGQSVEWRGIVTLRALATLRAHGRSE